MDDRGRTASSRIANALIEAARSRGADPADLIAAVGLDRRVLAEPDGRIPHARMLALFDVAAELTSDPDFGLNAAQRIPTTSFGVLGYIALSSPNLEEAFRRVCRCFRVLIDGEHVHFENTGEGGRFWHHFSEGERRARHSQEFSLACVLVNARLLSGLDFRPLRVRFPHARPENVTSHEQLFGCSVEFGSPAAELLIPADVLERPLMRADPQLLAILDHHTEELLRQLPERGTVVGQVRREISHRLTGYSPAIDEVATALGVSRRTLQRRLDEQGASYSGLLDELRHELARRHLDGETPIAELALLLGFSDAPAFHRAFVRWTGTTPAAYRSR